MLHFLTDRTKKRLLDLLARPKLAPDPKQFETVLRADTKTFRLRPFPELFESMGGIGTSFNICVREYVVAATYNAGNESVALEYTLDEVTETFAWVRNGLLHFDSTLLPSDDLDAGTQVAGEKYPRFVIYQVSSALSHGGLQDVQPIPPAP